MLTFVSHSQLVKNWRPKPQFLTSWDWDFLIQLAPRAGEVNVQRTV